MRTLSAVYAMMVSVTIPMLSSSVICVILLFIKSVMVYRIFLRVNGSVVVVSSLPLAVWTVSSVLTKEELSSKPLMVGGLM